MYLWFKVGANVMISNFNPVSIEESVTRPTTVPGSNRPVPRVTRIVYSYNENVRRIENWTETAFQIENLVNDRHPFAISTFVSRNTTEVEPTQEDSTMAG